MKIAVVGGGPGGLYFALLAKRADPRHRITVYERNRPDDTFGFGVVFSEKTMNYLREQDRDTHAEILAAANAWDPIEVRIHGRVMSCGGIGFWAVSRKRLLNILQRGAAAAGVDLLFENEMVEPEALLEENDLVVAADGVNSVFRTAYAGRFGPEFALGRTVFAWYGVARKFPSFTFLFEENRAGRFCAHIYPYEAGLSTFIVETDPESRERAGDVGLDYFEDLFAAHLDGHPLLENHTRWAPFRTLRNRSWHHRNLVLLGDAAHTAHFSVGSGTKMAMEDAIALAFSLRENGADLEATFNAYEAERRPRVEAIQRAARPSLRWYEQFRHYWHFGIERFSFHFLTRSNFDYGQLKERDPAFVEQVEAAVELGDLRRRILSRAEVEGRLALHLGRGGEHHRMLSPLTNPGVPLQERMRVPLAAVREARKATPGDLWVGISASDWLPGGFDDDEAVVLARALRDAGVDVVLVESGHVTPRSIPWYGRCFNAPFSDRVRNEAHVQTAVAGGILSADDARNVLLAGRADLVIADRAFEID